MLNHAVWTRCIDGIIPGGVSVTDFSKVVGIDVPTADRMLLELVQNSIGRVEGETVEFDEGDKLKAALYAIQKGAQIDDVAQHISWQDFEGLAAKILEVKDFAVVRNHVMTNPRIEIDIIGTKLGVAILIDCKHWKKISASALDEAVRKQVERTKQYVSRTSGAVAAPVIVTLYQDKVSFVGKVPIVPIFQLPSFVDEFYGNLEDVETIRKESQ